MFKTVEYRKHAQECRALAHNIKNEQHRNQLLKMAEAWDKFGDERERLDSTDLIGSSGA
jgi:hypothetical protein